MSVGDAQAHWLPNYTAGANPIMPEVSHFQHNVTVGYVTVVVDANQQVPAYWSHPQVGGPFPGLILLHDDWGLTEHIRALAHRFSEVGYYVLVPDLFEGYRAANQQQADTLEDHFKPHVGPKVDAALRALETHHKCNSKMAVLGWDLGAEIAIEMALERDDIMASVAFYGDASRFFGRLDQLNCPLLAIFGDADELTARTIEPLQAELNKSDKEHEVLTYSGAPHGFYNDMQPTYVADAAEDAWRKTLTFLRKHQGEPPPPRDASPGYFKPGRVY
jgi:carboxymethylenebutenolidase